MTVDEINNKLEQLENDHARKINNLQKAICKENEHYQRSKEFLSRQKEQAQKRQQNEHYNRLLKLIEKALDDINSIE
ncbi:MAG: hypothetical protein NC200_07075 [Candidatus Gastranaerophilales bacterium]|nr:hypothetical protein [Candidatus Gastranaerophilales bacterium]